MTTKTTGAKWERDQNESDLIVIRDKDGRLIRVVCRAATENDARLIAAAPALLAALRAMVLRYACGDNCPDPECPAAPARAALSKAGA